MKIGFTRWLTCVLVAAMTGVAMGEGGTITGIVHYAKNANQPARRPIVIGGDPFCVRQWAGKPAPLNEKWIFGKNDTLVNVFVWVSKGLNGKKFPPPKEAVLIDQVDCMYTPRVAGVMAGQKFTFRNSDPTLHNVNITTDPAIGNKAQNVGQPGQGMVNHFSYDNPETGIFVQCNVHNWMNCYLHIVEHPYFAVSDGEGKFTIKNLPPGEYELSTWHEFKVFQPDKETIKVTVKEGEEAKVEVTYAPKKRDED